MNFPSPAPASGGNAPHVDFSAGGFPPLAGVGGGQSTTNIFDTLIKPARFQRIYLLCLWTFISLTPVYGQSILEQSLKLSPQSGSIGSYLSLIQAQTGIVFSYNPQKIQLDRVVKLSGTERNLREYLQSILKDEGVSIIERNGKILLKPIKTDSVKRKRALRKTSPKYFTISGYIRETGSEEALIGASLLSMNHKKGAWTNVHGYFSLTLPAGRHLLKFGYVGYEADTLELILGENLRKDIFLEPSFELEEVLIEAREGRSVDEVNGMDALEVPLEKVQNLPLLMGEKDVLRTVQLLPGVQSSGEGQGGLYVRGGGPDQNLMLLDGAPIYNSSHLLGLVSVFYGESVKQTHILKSGFPARYGGRLSSVIDVRMKEGNKEELHGEFSLGVLSGTLNLEGPIVKEKTSFHLSARRTWLDAVTVPIMRAAIDENNGLVAGYNFSDLNVKIHHKFSSNDQIFLSGYLGRDKIFAEAKALLEVDQIANNIETLFRLRWGNGLGALKWTRLWGSKWFSTTTLTYTSYRYDYQQYINVDPNPDDPEDIVEQDGYSFSHISDWTLRSDIDFYPNPRHAIRIGGAFIAHTYTPQFSRSVLNEPGLPDNIFNISPSVIDSEFITRADEWNIYAEDLIELKAGTHLNLGLHLAFFRVRGILYSSPQARISLSQQLSTRHRIKASYSRMTQFIHLLTQPGLGFPSDLWVPSTQHISPEHAHHGAIGYSWDIKKGWRFRAEIYGKWMNNLLEYQDGATFFGDKEKWEDKVETGEGWSYGLETMIEKTSGKITGWIGYGLSRTQRRFENINRGLPFPYRYDRRHDLSVAITHKISDRIDLGLVWVYGSGHAVTLGLERYLALDAAEKITGLSTDLFPFFFSNTSQIPHLSERNNYRAPDYHRLDLAINLNKKKKRGLRTWSFGVYNGYNRKNPFSLYLQEDPMSGKFSLKKISLLPILPFASYRFKF